MVQTKGKGFSYQLPSDCHVDTFFQPQLLDSGSSGTHRAEIPEKEKVATLLCQSMDSRNTLPSCYQREIEGKIQVWPKVSVSVNQSGPTLNLQHSVCVCVASRRWRLVEVSHTTAVLTERPGGEGLSAPPETAVRHRL